MTGHGLPKKVPANRKSAARKERKRAYREAAGTAPTTIKGTSIPLVVPGTSTRHEQLRQSRRWLVERLFHKDNDVRINNPFPTLSSEAQQIVATIESERAGAVAAGNDGDWWEGESRKGVDHAQQKQFKDARDLQQAAEDGHEERLGLVSQEHETEDAALGAMTFEDMGLGSKTFDDIGYVSCDDELADEEVAGDGEEMAVDGGEATVQGEDMEGLEQADTTNMDVEMN